MKRLAIGCAIVAALAAFGFGIASCVLYSVAQRATTRYSPLAILPALNDRIRNRAPFQEPAEGLLEARQVEAYAAVQLSVRERLGLRARDLDSAFRRLAPALEQQGALPELRHPSGSWRDILPLVIEAKQLQVDALNASGLSLPEYLWIRRQVLLSLGHGSFAWNLESLASGVNAESIASAHPDARGGDDDNAPGVNPIQHNRDLLAPYAESAREWLPLGFFGL